MVQALRQRCTFPLDGLQPRWHSVHFCCCYLSLCLLSPTWAAHPPVLLPSWCPCVSHHCTLRSHSNAFLCHSGFCGPCGLCYILSSWQHHCSLLRSLHREGGARGSVSQSPFPVWFSIRFVQDRYSLMIRKVKEEGKPLLSWCCPSGMSMTEVSAALWWALQHHLLCLWHLLGSPQLLK